MKAKAMGMRKARKVKGNSVATDDGDDNDDDGDGDDDDGDGGVAVEEGERRRTPRGFAACCVIA